MNISDVFFKDHPQLFHYTTVDSCLSILSSQQLWATHYSFLNDRSELKAIEEALRHKLTDVITAAINRMKKDGSLSDTDIEQHGGFGKLIEVELQNSYDVIYGRHLNRGVLKELLDQFVVSFCTHQTFGRYTRDNGLLSQWISYGGAAGCALVFETPALVSLLKKEEDTYAVMTDLCEMVYLDQTSRIDLAFPKFRSCLDRAYECYRNQDRSSFPEDLLDEIVGAATRLKHQAFYSEHEVRIAVIPLKANRDDKGRKPKDIRYRVKGDLPIPYIQLFGTGERLPITKVIVGPARDQTRICRGLERLCAQSGIEVVPSETPLVI